jgi:2'-5' RNA ligase
MRSFIAVEIGDVCRRALEGVIEQLTSIARGVRWVKPDGLHLTLKFIGEMDEADLARAIECLQAVAVGSAPFVMSMSGISGFPPRGVPRVIYVELHEPTGVLAALQKEVEDELAEELNIAREDRPFAAHVTLGRTKDRSRCPSMDEIVAAVAAQDLGRVKVDSFVLMRSQLRPDGAIYTPVSRFPLGRQL